MGIIRICLLFVSFVCVSSLAASAQETVKVNRVGFLGITQDSYCHFLSLRKGLSDLGYEEHKNLEIEQRYADGVIERLPTLVDELTKAHVSVIVTGSIPAALAAKRVTASIPIVVAAAGDFVGNGLAASLQRPGGNITGIDEVVPGLSAKRLELLNEAVPVKSPVAILSSATGPTHAKQMQDSERAAQSLGVALKTFKIGDAKELDAAFDSIAQERAGALLVFSGVLTFLQSKRIVELASKNRLPAMYWAISFMNEGGLMYYGPNLPRMYEQSAALVDKILKGANPADIPVEYAKEFELIISLKAAKELGITIPQELIARANRVIQ
jgi:putative ABC transport system substrate-binding protein